MIRPRQNRVTPFGDLIAVAARGTLMGNRGRLHDPAGRIVRRVAGGYRAWVTCLLEFRGRRRTVMAPGRYTELFFLDEATALGGRPPAVRGMPPGGLSPLQGRLAPREPGSRGSGRTRPSPRSTGSSIGTASAPTAGRARIAAQPASLPDGVFVAGGPAEALLVWRGALVPWSPEGYGLPQPWRHAPDVLVLTPRSTVAAIAAGYVPSVHPTAWSSHEAGGEPPCALRLD